MAVGPIVLLDLILILGPSLLLQDVRPVHPHADLHRRSSFSSRSTFVRRGVPFYHRTSTPTPNRLFLPTPTVTSVRIRIVPTVWDRLDQDPMRP